MRLTMMVAAVLALCGCGPKCDLTSGEYECSCLNCRSKDIVCKGHTKKKPGCELWCKKCNKQSVITERVNR